MGSFPQSAEAFMGAFSPAQTAAPALKAEVLFNGNSVALYLTPEGEERRAKHRLIELPRLGTSDDENHPNVRLLRAMAKAATDLQAEGAS